MLEDMNTKMDARLKMSGMTSSSPPFGSEDPPTRNETKMDAIKNVGHDRSSPPVVSGDPSSFVHPRMSVHPRSVWRVYPRFQAGIHLYKPQIAKVVGNTDEERSFFSRNGHNMEVIGQPVF